MISKQVVDPKTRLEPMLRDALERLSFGIEIISIQVFDDMIAVGGPPRPCVIMAIMCKGTIIGPNAFLVLNEQSSYGQAGNPAALVPFPARGRNSKPDGLLR